ncbi:hypothetical protein HK097_003395 [Rhizophlyctis rosea]|uniref:histidine kinase n=1 Tax=Rhizophlyctis rosea TaxID=64517 RepID=A0AAD5X9Y6_9FUNG|nr:hypothetical protein HK097_003395 [Rhizophlyctis rosea]
MGFNKGASAIVVLPGERQDTNGPPSRSDLHSDSNIASPGSASRPAHGIHSLNDCHEALKIARETGDGKTYDFRILRVNRPVHDKFGLETEGEILEKWIHKDLRRPQGRVDMFCRGLMESRYKGVVEFAVNLPVTMDGKSWRFEMPSTSDAFPNSDKKPIDPHAWRHVSFTCQHIETVQTEDGRENDRFNIVMQDTNAEWEMVKALQMSEERLRQALEATNDGIWEWHIPTGHIRFSERLAKIFGFAPDELEGDITAWDKMVHKDDLSRVQQQRYAHLDGRIPFYDVEKRVRTKSGEWRWIQNRAKVVEWDEHGKAMRMVGAQTDITDRKSFEIALEEKNRQLDLALHQAAAAAQSKSEFLANITHEIRTPLNGIIGLSNILADTTLNDDQKDLLESVRDCSDGLLMIVNDVLDFSKIEAGKLDLENKPFNVHNCLKGALYPLRLRAEEKGIELGTDIRSGTPEWMSGDVHRLRQVLNNLVSNAVKFTSVGAVNVMLSGSIIDDERGKRVRIQCDVKDTGIGIPPNRMDRLFKSFSQVDTSTSRRFGGTGLGLAISKNLVEMMDPEEGRMWVDSEEGKGSTFSFCVCGGWCDEEKGEGIGSANSRTRINATAASRSASTGSVGSVESLGSAASLKSEARGKLLGGVVGKKVVGSPTVESGPANGTGEAGGKEGGVGTTRRRDGERKGLSRQNTELSLLNNRKEKELLLADWLPMNILVAEDNLINQKLALRLLQRQGYIPDMANNGAEAVEAVKQKTFDIILMDVQMPIMSGLEATNLIRNLPRSILPVQPVIIALTANAMVGDKEKCLKSGMESHISKPVKTDQLMRELEVWGAVAKSRKVVAEGNGNRGEMMGLVGDEEMEGVDGGLDGQGGAGGQAHQESSRSTPSLVLP